MLHIAHETLLRKKVVLELLGISKSTLYNRIKDGSISQGVPLGPRLRAWPASEIQAYIQSCIAQRDALRIRR